MSTVKVTKKTRFEEMKAIFEAQGDTVHAEFCQHEIELLDKKNSSRSGKPTAQQKANNAVKESILDEMENGVEYTITDMIKQLPSCADFTNQRTSALVRQLVKDNLVIRTEKKGRAYFSLPSEGEE
jgi:hypothetical protein